MKEFLIFGIFLYITRRKKTTAKEIANEFEISIRSVYRYVDALSLVGVPIVTKIGKGGGIEVIGDFYLENISLSTSEKNVLRQFLNDESNIAEVKKIISKII